MKTKKALAGLLGLFGSFPAFLVGFLPAPAAALLFSLTNPNTKKMTVYRPAHTKSARNAKYTKHHRSSRRHRSTIFTKTDDK